MNEVKVAVIGGGIFGVTVAIRLARHGCSVDLYEKSHDILTAASGINQYRLHRGYHYPRSFETAYSSKQGEAGFIREYPEAVIDSVEHYYCIANRDSLTSADQYLAFCGKLGLEHTPVEVDWVRQEAVDLCLRVEERLIDPGALRKLCWQKLRSSQVCVKLNTQADGGTLARYDRAVICTYSNINSLLEEFPEAQRDYQYELCEKPVVRLPEAFRAKSVVVLDGPFMSVDPFGRTGFSVLGSVVHAIHSTSIGKAPMIGDEIKPLLNNGVIKDPPTSKFHEFITSGMEFLPFLEKAEHLGSMFTFRAVLPNKEETDERPSIVQCVGDKLVTVFSGKIGTCVEAADQVATAICES